MGPKFTSMWFSCIFIKCSKSTSILSVFHIILNGGRSKGQRSKVLIQKLFGISSCTSEYKYHYQRSNGSWAFKVCLLIIICFTPLAKHPKLLGNIHHVTEIKTYLLWHLVINMEAVPLSLQFDVCFLYLFLGGKCEMVGRHRHNTIHTFSIPFSH